MPSSRDLQGQQQTLAAGPRCWSHLPIVAVYVILCALAASSSLQYDIEGQGQIVAREKHASSRLILICRI